MTAEAHDAADDGIGGHATADGRRGEAGDAAHCPDPATRAREAVDHLQSAARELIAAARAALDVADELVNDPETVAAAARALVSFGDLVRHRPGPLPGPDGGDHDDTGGPTGDPAERRPGPSGTTRVERIRVL